jgi:hypothetical protein
MHTSVKNLVYTYSGLQHVSAKYMAITKGRKYEHEIHKCVKRNCKIIYQNQCKGVITIIEVSGLKKNTHTHIYIYIYITLIQ